MPESVGSYLVFDELGAGGMATVHFGGLRGPLGFRRVVAIKRLKRQYLGDPRLVAMMLDEARLAARIHHPNVVPTLDVVLEDGEVSIVMEYVHGESLARLLRGVSVTDDLVDERIVAAIVCGILHGLHAAHEATDARGAPLHLVHRDVSPQNVLVGEDGGVRILDFGIAKSIGHTQATRSGEVKGKIAYLAPELLEGARATRQADIYAAAVLLWETLTRQRLFSGSGSDLVTQVMRGEIEAPSVADPAVATTFDAIVLRGLSRDPSARYATARDMALEIERSVSPAAPSEIGRWVERYAAESLEARATTIRRLETAPRAPRVPPRSSKRIRSRVGVAVFAAILLGIATSLSLREPPRKTSPPEVTPEPSTRAAELEEEEDVSAEDATARVPPSRVRRLPRPPSRAAAPQQTAPLCTPTFDARGHKHWTCRE